MKSIQHSTWCIKTTFSISNASKTWSPTYSMKHLTLLSKRSIRIMIQVSTWVWLAKLKTRSVKLKKLQNERQKNNLKILNKEKSCLQLLKKWMLFQRHFRKTLTPWRLMSRVVSGGCAPKGVSPCLLSGEQPSWYLFSFVYLQYVAI